MSAFLLYTCLSFFFGPHVLRLCLSHLPLFQSLKGPGQALQYIKLAHVRLCVCMRASVRVCVCKQIIFLRRCSASLDAHTQRRSTRGNKGRDKTPSRSRRGFVLNWFRLKDNCRWCWMMELEELAPISPTGRPPAKSAWATLSPLPLAQSPHQYRAAHWCRGTVRLSLLSRSRESSSWVNVFFQSRSKSTIGQIKASKIRSSKKNISCPLAELTKRSCTFYFHENMGKSPRTRSCFEMANYSLSIFLPRTCCEAVSIARPVPLLTVSGRLSLRFRTAMVSMFTSRWEAHNCSAISPGQENLRRLSHQNSLYLLSQSPFSSSPNQTGSNQTKPRFTHWRSESPPLIILGPRCAEVNVWRGFTRVVFN